MTKRSIWFLYAITTLLVIGTIGLIEWSVRRGLSTEQISSNADQQQLVLSLARSTISGREIGNQMLVHNIALFSDHPAPDSVKVAYVGTSRTKILRPKRSGHTDAVNASGNSYNEISYGLLLQAEIARRQFPNLKQVYVETSLLLRRPDRLIVEPDHAKYLPLLEELLPLRDQLAAADIFRNELTKAKTSHNHPRGRLVVLEQRNDIRLTKLLHLSSPTADSDGKIPVRSDRLFQELDPSGERRGDPPASIPRANQRPEITADNVKVQRLREIRNWAPWDGLFDMVALWGKAHGIEIVLFQPPVRSDLYRYQLQMGLKEHVADLERVATTYGIPFIDLNRPELGYMKDWTIFSDEDHMETCYGVVLLQSALDAGIEAYLRTRDLMPVVPRDQVERKASTQLVRCDDGAMR